MRKLICISLSTFLLLTLSVTTHAAETPTPTVEEDCPAIVQTAITLTNLRCETTGANQACYGHLVLDAQPRTGLSPFNFTEPGDVVDVVAVQSMRLSAMDTLTGQWGVVLMQIEAALAEARGTLDAGDNVQILLFGDVELADANQFITATAREGANIRRLPRADSAVITSLAVDDVVTVSGRLEDDSWLRVRLPAGEENVGWIFADLLELDGDIDQLATVTLEDAVSPPADDRARFGPMQAFYFQSGTSDSPCPQAPNSGVLIQTPEGVAYVTIWMDEVIIQMEGTAYVNAQPDGDLTFSVLDGSAQVEAQGDTRTVVAGAQVAVPIDDTLTASDTPADPQPYTQAELQSLPLELLNQPVTPNPSLVLPPGTPIAGSWRFTWGADFLTCPDGTDVPFESTGAASALLVDESGLDWGGSRYERTAEGVYRATYVDGNGNLHQDTLRVTAFDRIEGEKVLDLVSPACTLDVAFRLQLIRPAD